jgi:site-specific DNA recombinase
LNNSLSQEQLTSRSEKKQQRERLQHRLSSVLRHIDQSYLDKLDGKIEEDFWRKKTSEWRMEEQQIQMAIQGLEQANPDQLLTAKRTLELANKAYFLYVTQTSAEKGKLLKMVLSNCAFDGVTLYPTYRKPFDLIFQRAKSKEWCARRDSNSRPSDS